MMKPSGIEQFLNHFDKVNSSLTLKSPFQKASSGKATSQHNTRHGGFSNSSKLRSY